MPPYLIDNILKQWWKNRYEVRGEKVKTFGEKRCSFNLAYKDDITIRYKDDGKKSPKSLVIEILYILKHIDAFPVIQITLPL